MLRIALIAFFSLTCLTMTAQISPGTALTGAWEGQMLLGGNWRFMEAEFGDAVAKVDLPQERREFRDFTTQGNRLQWTLVRGQGRIRFDGLISGNRIRGQAEQNGVVGEFQLARIDRAKPNRAPALAATSPVLAIHGSEDLDVPASKNSPLFAKLSTHSSSQRRVLDRADHYMLVGVANPDTQYRRLNSDYLKLMIDWIQRAARNPQ